MNYIFLGTATSQGVPVIACNCEACTSTDPRDKRLRTAMLLQGTTKNYVIDAGPDFRAQMLRENVQHLNGVLLTHEHTDHMIGMDDLRPFIFRQKEDMPIYALDRVLHEVKKRFDYAFGARIYPGAPRFKMIPIAFNDQLELEELSISVLRVNHGDLEIAGFLINDFLAYITDAKTLSKEVIERIKGCKILVINALRKEKHHSHLNLEEALALCEAVGAKRSYLIHLSHLMGTTVSFEDSLPENVSVAYDQLVINDQDFI